MPGLVVFPAGWFVILNFELHDLKKFLEFEIYF